MTLTAYDSRWLQLPLRETREGGNVFIAQVERLKTEMGTPAILVKLRRETHMNPKLKNDTRCRSIPGMLLMHAEQREHVI